MVNNDLDIYPLLIVSLDIISFKGFELSDISVQSGSLPKFYVEYKDWMMEGYVAKFN